MKGRMTLAVAALALVATGAPAHAQSKCTGAKLKASGKKAACKLGLYAKEAAKNVAADPTKLAACSTKHSAAYAKAESKADCIAATGDEPTIEGKVDGFVSDVDTTMVGGNTLPSKCISSKLKAASKKAVCKLGLYSKAAAKNLPVDTTKLATCGAKFSSASVKAEGGTDCGTAAGDADTIETKVDAFVADVDTSLASAGPVCGNSTTEPPTETCDDGNATDESMVHTLPPDPCPANCRIEPCSSTSGTVSVSVNFSSSSSIAGYTIFVDYPEGKVVIPGTGQPAAGVITNDPTGNATANDLDYGVLVVAGGLNAIPPSRLFTINFTPCTGAALTAAEFSCKVDDASDPGGNSVPMTCSVSIP